MRHILGGLSVIALLAAALPAAAQTSAQTPSVQKGAATAPAKPMHHKARRNAAAKTSPDDSIADRLNQQELSQINQGQAPASGTSTSPQAPQH